MQLRIRRHWPILAGAALLLLIGTLVVCKTTPGCFLGDRTGEPLSSTLGDKNMSITGEKQLIQHATDSTFRSLVLDSNRPVLVDFYADWCGPCRRLAPVLEELAAENPGMKIVKVNVDQCPELAERYRVDAIPALKVFKNGQVAEEMMGLASKERLQALLAP
jgi:thioredoxin 1